MSTHDKKPSDKPQPTPTSTEPDAADPEPTREALLAELQDLRARQAAAIQVAQDMLNHGAPLGVKTPLTPGKAPSNPYKDEVSYRDITRDELIHILELGTQGNVRPHPKVSPIAVIWNGGTSHDSLDPQDLHDLHATDQVLYVRGNWTYADGSNLVVYIDQFSVRLLNDEPGSIARNRHEAIRNAMNASGMRPYTGRPSIWDSGLVLLLVSIAALIVASLVKAPGPIQLGLTAAVAAGMVMEQRARGRRDRAIHKRGWLLITRPDNVTQRAGFWPAVTVAATILSGVIGALVAKLIG